MAFWHADMNDARKETSRCSGSSLTGTVPEGSSREPRSVILLHSGGTRANRHKTRAQTGSRNQRDSREHLAEREGVE
jgi:hypothetical protein